MRDIELKNAIDGLSATLAEVNLSLRLQALLQVALSTYTDKERENFNVQREILAGKANELRKALLGAENIEALQELEEFKRLSRTAKTAAVGGELKRRMAIVKEADQAFKSHEESSPLLTQLAYLTGQAAKPLK